jgi:hypothetical protein
MIPLAVAIVLVLGCGKKKEEGGGGDGVAVGVGGGEPTGPAITIKIRDEQKGDKIAVTKSKNTTIEIKAKTPKGPVAKTQKTSEREEFTETVLDMPPGGDRATKATRDYKVAEKREDGAAKSRSYANKTVLIEKKGSKYSFTVNGTPLAGEEAKKFQDEYEKTDKLKNEDVLPKKAVQVNEKWSLDHVILKKVGTAMDLPISAEKSSGSGRLTKTYTKNGQQWGTIEIKIEVVLDGTKEGLTLSGTLTMTQTVDTAIDGSSLDGSMKTTMNGKVTAKQAAGVEVEQTFDGGGEETRTTVK